MKTHKNKSKISMIALFLMLIMFASTILAVSPLVNAQTVQKYPTFLYAAVAPNPIGRGQPVAIVTWTAEIPPDIGETAGTVVGVIDPATGFGGRAGWDGVTVTISKPDNTSETVTLGHSDPVGNNYYVYTPDQIGTYTVQTHFPETWKNSTTSSTTPRRLYAAADSNVATFTVQEEPLSFMQGVPLPTEYWSRPIYSTNREWSTISGNWITGLRDLPQITAPNSAHIIWTAPYGFGGIAGGQQDETGYHTGSAYENKFSDPQIMNGMLFYTQSLEDSVTTSHTQIIARDLLTGEIKWTQNGTSTAGASMYEYDSPNQHGVHPYLWTSGTFRQALSPGVTPPANTVIDPFTGVELFTFTDVPTGTWAVGPLGERYQIVFYGSSSNRTAMALWNSSAIPSELLGTSGTNYWQWRPVGKIHNGTFGYVWNTTIPAGLGTTYQVYVFDDRVISGTGFVQFGTSAYHETFSVWALSTKPESRGTLLWKIDPKPPAANVTLQWCAASVDEGVLILRAKETRQFIAFDIDTGDYLWTTDSQPSWMMFSSGADLANGMLYSSGYGGQVFAYSLTDGKLVWTANTDTEGLESAYEMTPLSQQVVDGKVFVRSQEHSHTQPLYRSWKVYALDATTGDRIWDLNGYWSAFGFSDGVAVGLNSMDNQIYAIGKGPTAITATIQNDIIAQGNSVLIKGLVTDISAGTKSSTLSARFPDGVPVTSEASMTDWMQYVYMNMPKPTNASGVTVNFDVIDANGNSRPIGTTTTNTDGFYSFNWTPDITGPYTVTASFQGSESYWPSHANTAFVVNEPAPTASPPPALNLPPTEMYVLGIGVAIIIAIAIVGALILMAVKRRA